MLYPSLMKDMSLLNTVQVSDTLISFLCSGAFVFKNIFLGGGEADPNPLCPLKEILLMVLVLTAEERLKEDVEVALNSLCGKEMMTKLLSDSDTVRVYIAWSVTTCLL